MSRNSHIRYYFENGYTYSEIVDFLSRNQNLNITVRHLKRILKAMDLKRKKISETPMEEILAAMIEELDGSGCCLGYKTLWRRLQLIYRLNVKRNTVLDILRIMDPDGISQRSRHRLQRRKYKVPGPNFLWHVDGYDKLKPFGFAIHGCIDGFSRKILWLEVATSNNKPEIIAHYYLKTLQKLRALPTMIRSDHGTENSLIECLQKSLRHYHDDRLSGAKSFIKGKSTSNQRIESYWSQMRRQGAEFWISLFKDMRESNLLNDSNELYCECLRFCFGPLIAYDLEIIRKEWNLHRIRKQKTRNSLPGKPNCLYYLPERYGAEDYKKQIDEEDIRTCLNNYSLKPTLFDPRFEELVALLIPNMISPSNVEEAVELYGKLTSLLEEREEIDT